MQEKNYSVSYNVDLAKQYGLPVAVLVFNVRYFSATHNADGNGNEYYHSMRAIAEATGLSYRQVRDAAKKAQEAGLINVRQGFIPGTNNKTTFWASNSQNGDSEVNKTATSEVNKTATSYIYKNKRDKTKRDIGKGENVNSNPELERVYRHYLKLFGTTANRYKLTDKRKAKLRARLADCGADMICEAIDHARDDYWYNGDNQKGWKADLDFIIRSYENVEKLANLTPRQRQLTWQERKDAEEQAEFDRKFKPIMQEQPQEYYPIPEGSHIYGASKDPNAPTREPFSDEFIEEMRQRALGGKRRKENSDD